LEKTPMDTCVERIVWNDLGSCNLVVKDCAGEIVSTLDTLCIDVQVVNNPLVEDPFGWLYRDIDRTQWHW
jgi:hypothetical protein